jgi:hypothetical protein
MLGFVVYASPALSFDVDGFKTGMTLEQSIGVARSNGFSLVNRRDDRFTVFDTSLSSKQRLSFCKGLLSAYTKPLKDLGAFVVALDQNTKAHGKATYITTGYEGSSAIHSLLMGWSLGSERFSLQAQQWDTAEYFSISWGANNDCDHFK